jgi:hypothetical protein
VFYGICRALMHICEKNLASSESALRMHISSNDNLTGVQQERSYLYLRFSFDWFV